MKCDTHHVTNLNFQSQRPFHTSESWKNWKMLAFHLLLTLTLHSTLLAAEKYLGPSQILDPQLIVNTTLYGPIYGQFNPASSKQSSSKSKDGGAQQEPPSPDSYVSFRGLRYAAPPVLNLRFAPPVKYTSFVRAENDSSGPPPHFNNNNNNYSLNRTLDARNYGSPCIQFFRLGSGREDCLFINVNVPHPDRVRARNGKLMPVVIWIFGGINFLLVTNN